MQEGIGLRFVRPELPPESWGESLQALRGNVLLVEMGDTFGHIARHNAPAHTRDV